MPTMDVICTQKENILYKEKVTKSISNDIYDFAEENYSTNTNADNNFKVNEKKI